MLNIEHHVEAYKATAPAPAGQVSIFGRDEVEAALLGEALADQGFAAVHFPISELGVMLEQAEGSDLAIFLCKAAMKEMIDFILARRGVMPVAGAANDPDLIEHVMALELGADDFISLGAHPRLIGARVRALLRRGAPTNRTPSGGWRLDRAGRLVRTPGGHEVRLTPTETDALALLVEREGAPVTHAEIESRTAGARGGNARMLLSRLRKKLTAHGDPSPVCSVWRTGYAFRSEP